MQAPVTPIFEQLRLLALHNTGLLDTAPEQRFDRLTHLAKLCLGTEIVLISLVDAKRQWFKSKQGLAACETSRDISFCGHTILAESIFEIHDAQLDSRFADNPLVTGAPFIRFYAGVPLEINGERIGTLCFIDSQPRQFTDKERQIAFEFGKSVEQEIQDRLQEQSNELLAASELMYRSVLEGTRIGTWQWNIQTGETVFNERWAEMIGYQLAELEPISIDTWLAVTHPDDLDHAKAALEDHFNGLSPFYDVNFRMQHKQGHFIWVHDRGRVISYSDDGKPLMMYGTHADITKQHDNELALRQSRDQFKTLVTNIPGVTYRCHHDEHWSMLYMSDHIYALSGYLASDFIDNSQRSFVSIIHPEDRDLLIQTVEKAVLNHASWVLNFRILHQNGSVLWAEGRGAAEYDSRGAIKYLDGFILDISKEKKLQDQLHKLTQQLPGVLYQFQLWPDGHSAFPYASSAIEDIYGVKPEDVQTDASTAFAKIYPEDLPAVAKSIEDSAQQLTLWEQEYRVYRDDNTLVWLSGSASPENMPDGSILWHGYIQDITQTKEHYLKLEDLNLQLNVAQQSLDLASEQAQIGYWHASLKQGTLWWSPIIYQIFGFDAHDIVPSVTLLKSAVHPDDIDKVDKSEQQARLTGIHNVVHRIIRPNGEVRWVHQLGQLVAEDKNPDQIIIGSVQDVTDRMQLQQVKDDFISTVSHELRTPLTSIFGALNLLQSGKLVTLPAKADKLIEIASSNCKQLSRLINDLLDIEKLAAGKMLFEMKRLNVVPLLQRAIDDHQPYADLHQITLALQLNHAMDEILVYVDEHRLLQILTNFLSNAVKFSPTAGSVTLSTTLIGNQVEIAVQDQGDGIPEDFQSKIFERFSQADASSSKAKGGTGLGLALCKELTEAMNGSIGYSSTPGYGARFYIRLPISV
ncbi:MULTISPECIES: PAS domain-containing protein [Shewanella]|uniref:PAS domain-containing protein n=1 Tax=Shewanella TaxID=22 RepID=UPI000C657F40|nr:MULTISPECIES: PAS domain-containing protein [Shewanella]NCQ46068.1 PAS domain-containing protein [Shewanella frigidimarina]NCO70526.1 PAS domain-containing protein [Shewanella vesiculosa]NCP36402.1 PAS domain-containing protein [Shewanella vesiculosa]NCP69683.1 PAS domain-containing protein [Shewanella vesiculosa]NCP74934.1 PAS domain-containing protein [Shewanella vesiculosa]